MDHDSLRADPSRPGGAGVGGAPGRSAAGDPGARARGGPGASGSPGDFGALGAAGAAVDDASGAQPAGRQRATGPGPALHGRREPELSSVGSARAATSALDRARAHARASAQAQQAAVRMASSDGTSDQLAEAAAAAQSIAAAESAAATRARELRPQDQKPLDRFRGVHALQIVTAEVAVLAAVAFHRHPLVVALPVLVAAVATLVFTFGRRRGAWLYQWLFLGLRFVTRRRARSAVGPGAAYRPFAAEAVLDRLQIDDAWVGVLRHRGGFTAVVEPVYADGVGRSAAGGVLPPLGDLLPASSESAPQVSLQILVHTIPAPGQLTAEDAAAASYAELAGGAVPAQRRALVAVQVQHVPGTFLPPDLDATLRNALRRLRRKLAKAGFEVNLLTGAELGREFAGVARGALSDPDAATVDVREGWRDWQAGSTRHVTYRILGWPNLADATGARLIEHVSAAPSLDTTVAIAARNVDGVVEVEAAVRLQSAGGSAVDAAREALSEVVQRCGASLERLDGRHAFGMSASVPLGGFVA